MSRIEIGDKVLFLLPNYPVYVKEGNDVYGKLKVPKVASKNTQYCR